MAEKRFEYHKEIFLLPFLKIKSDRITLRYKDSGVRDSAFSMYYIKKEKEIFVYSEKLFRDIDFIKKFKNEKKAIKFCKKNLEEQLKKLLG